LGTSYQQEQSPVVSNDGQVQAPEDLKVEKPKIVSAEIGAGVEKAKAGGKGGKAGAKRGLKRL
jgi:hypothetical protein